MKNKITAHVGFLPAAVLLLASCGKTYMKKTRMITEQQMWFLLFSVSPDHVRLPD